jgi:hypothetical protein
VCNGERGVVVTVTYTPSGHVGKQFDSLQFLTHDFQFHGGCIALLEPRQFTFSLLLQAFFITLGFAVFTELGLCVVLQSALSPITLFLFLPIVVFVVTAALAGFLLLMYLCL